MRRIMKVILSILLLGSGLSESAYALSPDFHLGFESDFSRDVVTPSTFSIVKGGLNFETTNSSADLELKMSPIHPKVFAVSSKNAFYQITDANTDDPSAFHFAFGRKWINWSQADEDWGLGAFNSLDSWDRLRSFSQGLTGIFIAADSNTFHFDIFASCLFLPEITPNVVIENNHFEYFHPQAVSAGPEAINLLNRATPLGYNLLIPSLSSIIFRPSLLLSVDTKKNIEPFYSKVSFGYLPLNYFPMALEASLAIPIDQVVVDLRPRLLSHTLASAEVVYQWNPELKSGLSVIRDQILPENSLPTDYTTATLGTTTYFSPWIKFKTMELSHIYSQGGIGADVGPYANPNQNLFSSRILYRNATQFKVSFFELTGKFLHEYSINANWIALDWNHSWSSHWNSFVGGDVISAEYNAAPDGGAEFLSDLRALDRIRLGVNYVF